MTNPEYEGLDNAGLEKLKLIEELKKMKLERQKLDKDMATYDERLNIERSRITADRGRFRQETVRLVLIALVTAGIGFLVNFKTEQVKSELTTNAADYNRCIQDAKDNLNRKISDDSLRQFSCSFRITCGNHRTDYIKGLQSTLDTICRSLSAKQAVRSRQEQQDTATRPTVSPQLVQKIDSADVQRNHIQQQLKTLSGNSPEKAILLKRNDSLKAALDFLISKIPEGTQKAAASQQLTADYTTQSNNTNTALEKARKTVDSNNRVQDSGYPKTSWFKKNYFLVFDDFKIVLTNIDKSAGRIGILICGSTNPIGCEDPIGSVNLTYNSGPFTFHRNGFQYNIKLDHIGTGGINFLTLAAYITVEKYNIDLP
ncbi:MAG TPA: hypothetical protein VNS58_08530 [Puia sp.]|nr:hypothetical protein [Puia sp.]